MNTCNTCYICEQTIQGSVEWFCDENEEVRCRCVECRPGTLAYAKKFPDTLASQLFLLQLLEITK